MEVFEKGKLSNYKKGVAPHLEDEYTEKEFTEAIFNHIVDLPDALKHIFKDLDFEVGGMSPQVVFLRCKKADINIIIKY